MFEIFCLNRINACKDHRLDFFKSINGFVARAFGVCDGVAHFHFGGGFDAADDVAYIAAVQNFAWRQVHFQYADFICVIALLRVDKQNVVALLDGAVYNLKIGDDASEGVEHRVENQGLQWSRLVANGSGDVVDNSVENVFYAHTGFAGGADDFLTLAPEQIYDFVFNFFWH